MGNLSTSYTFVNDTTADASQVNTNNADIVNYINARNQGLSKWDEIKTAGDCDVDGDLNVAGINVASLLTSDGWLQSSETWTYASVTSFTVDGDKTGKYSKGDKIKLTQTTVKYFYIINVTYSSPNTTITIYAGSDYSLANASITSPYYSKQTTPVGFPARFSFSPTITGFSSTLDNNCSFSLNGRMIFINYEINGTSNATSFFATLPTITLDTTLDSRCAIASAFDNGNHVTSGNPIVNNELADRLSFGRDRYDGAWTSSGQKTAIGVFIGYIA